MSLQPCGTYCAELAPCQPLDAVRQRLAARPIPAWSTPAERTHAIKRMVRTLQLDGFSTARIAAVLTPRHLPSTLAGASPFS